MANINQTSRKITGTISLSASTTPIIYNVSAPTAGTPVSQALSTNTKKILIRVRGNANAQFTFVSGETNTKFITISRGSAYNESNLNLTSTTLFIQTDKNSQLIEILEWS